MFTPSGEKLEAVDAMTLLWSGKAAEDLCPEITAFELDGSGTFDPGDNVTARLSAFNLEGASLQVEWKVCPEAPDYLTFGETWWQPFELDGIIQSSSTTKAELQMPGGGLYRLYVTVKDGKGGAATANVPFQVKGEKAVPRLKLPLIVYSDDNPSPWAPSGWMGEVSALKVDFSCAEQPYRGKTCLLARLEPNVSWAGVAWQDPPDDWGSKPGGYDLSGAKQLSFWAKGKFGDEKVNFGVGLLKSDVPYPDSDIAILESVKLTKNWKHYRINLHGKDLTRVKIPFWWSAKGSHNSVVFYLDDVSFE